MPPVKQIKDTRSAEEIAIQSAMTSHYNTLVPGYKAKHIRIKNPLTGKDPLFSVEDPAFFEMFYELSQKGLKDKMMKEIEIFKNIPNVMQHVNKDLDKLEYSYDMLKESPINNHHPDETNHFLWAMNIINQCNWNIR